MDPIVGAAIAGLTAFVTSSAEHLLTTLGSAAAEKVRNLFALVKGHWAQDPEASGDLDRFSRDPELYQPVVKSRLQALVLSDPDARAEIAQIVQDIGPHLAIVQRMATAHGVTGLDVDQFHRGSVSVEQNIGDATDVTGAKFKSIG